MNPIDPSFAFGSETGQDEGIRGAEVGCDQLGAGQAGGAANIDAAVLDSHLRPRGASNRLRA